MREPLLIAVLLAVGGLTADSASISAQSQTSTGRLRLLKPDQQEDRNKEKDKPPTTTTSEADKTLMVPAWRTSSFGKDCYEIDDGKGGKKKVCPPASTPAPPSTPPPKISPCSEVGSCAPGVGSEGGTFDSRKGETVDKLLGSGAERIKLRDPLITSIGSKTGGREGGNAK